MNKASGGDGIPVELFQILKDDAALNMPANLENSVVATGLEKVSFHNNPKSVGHYKSSHKGKVHSNTGIPQETRKKSNK